MREKVAREEKRGKRSSIKNFERSEVNIEAACKHTPKYTFLHKLPQEVQMTRIKASKNAKPKFGKCLRGMWVS